MSFSTAGQAEVGTLRNMLNQPDQTSRHGSKISHLDLSLKLRAIDSKKLSSAKSEALDETAAAPLPADEVRTVTASVFLASSSATRSNACALASVFETAMAGLQGGDSALSAGTSRRGRGHARKDELPAEGDRDITRAVGGAGDQSGG